ncbi:MAG TPA: putative sulfate exporter family transporter [Thermoanaerobaculales bacterium]|nr:putative sulfate exporter family transporter [Thermoanaerobaculales bacterium]HQP42554.1 putative sulfate exporter family transporter [Thermoanaerobaculales bacterium]
MDRAISKLWTTEDYWAVWLGLGVVLLALAAYWAGGSIRGWAVTPGSWSAVSQLGGDLARHWGGYLAVFALFGIVFAVSMAIMGRSVGEFVRGFVLLFAGSLAVSYLAGWSVMKKADLGAPLLALLIGLLIGNLVRLPVWFETCLRTEYYIKTGIVLLGATLPLTLIFTAGPIAFLQATIVSVCTWLTIYLAATRFFGLEPQFGAVLGAGGAVCGVSASIAVGGAVKAKKDHIAIGIAVVSVWAIVMILVLSVVVKLMVPAPISPGEAGAWVGTSEFADAAGFAVVAELSAVIESGSLGAADGTPLDADDPINTFTLMKVIGRDMWIGIWCLILSVVSVMFWEKGEGAGRAVGVGVVWERFPKFVLGFFAASILMTAVSARVPADHVGRAQFAGTFRSGAEKIVYDADFTGYLVPPALAAKVSVDAAARELRFEGGGAPMTLREYELLRDAIAAGDPDRRDKIGALKELRRRSDWFEGVLGPRVIDPIKTLRSWAFVLCFLCIGLSTRFRDLLTFGLAPFWAFTIGVAVNVPLGYFLSTVVFSRYWSNIGDMM